MTDTAGDTSTLHGLWRDAWSRPRGRWPAARWGLGLLVPLALVLWGLSVVFAPDDPSLLRISIESQATGGAIEGATVIVDGLRYVTDASGTITIDPAPGGTDVMVSAAGHESAHEKTSGEPGESLSVSLSAVLVIGSVTDIVSGVPVEGAGIIVLDAAGEEVTSTRTDESGTFVFKFIPEDAEIIVSHDFYGAYSQQLEQQRSLLIQLDPLPVTGQIVDEDGQPIPGVTITGAQVDAASGIDGTFIINGVGQGMELTFQADGHGSRTVPVTGTDLGAIKLPGPSASPAATPAAAEGEG